MHREYVILSLYIVLWFTLGLIVPIIIKIRKGSITPAQAIEFKLDNILVYSYFFITLCIFFVCFIKTPHKLSNSEEVLTYAKKGHLDTYQFYCYYNNVQENPYDYESIFNLNLVNERLGEANSGMDLRLMPDFKSIESESGYALLTNSEDLKERDLGFFGMAMCNYIYKSDISETLLDLAQISDKRKGFVNYLYSLCGRSDSVRVRYLQAEIQNKGAVKAAVEQLCNIYSQNDRWADFEKVYKDPGLKFYISQKSILKYLHYNGYYSEYFITYFKQIRSFEAICVLILILILYYLFIQIYPGISKKRLSIGCIFFTSILLGLIKIYISDYIEFNSKQNSLIQWIETISVSELLKIIPFLFLFYVSKQKREPIDYLFYAGISVLGFCGVNLVIEYSNQSVNSIFSKVIFRSFSEICSTSLFVYALILGRFYYNKNSLPFFFIGFFIAVASGFLYKWLDLTGGPVNLFFLVVTFFLQVWCFIHTVNNCLSNSFGNMSYSQLNVATMSKVLASVMILFEIMIYLYNSFVVSDEFATEEYFTMGVIYFPVIYLFSIILRRIDPFPGEWDGLSFKKLADPKIFLAGLNPEYNYLIGKEVSLTHHGKQTLSLAAQLPTKGQITTRRKIDNYKGWFEMELDYPLKFKGIEISTIYFRSELNDQPLFKDSRNQIKIYMLRDGVVPLHMEQMTFVDIVSLYI